MSHTGVAHFERALLIAAKAPRPGRVKTRLAPMLGEERAHALARALLADTLALAHGLRRFVSTTLVLDGDPADVSDLDFLPQKIRPQHGNHLGERLVQMIEDAFATTAADAVCVIGSDAPHLPAAFILEAFGRIQRGDADVVLGPADDGGYTLVTVARPSAVLFEDIPWSEPDVLERTIARAKSAELSPTLLPPWYDIDTPADVMRLGEDLRRGVVHAPATKILIERWKTAL